MSTMQAETELVQGQVVGITQKGQDKWQVAVQPPNSQYTRNLWTKDEQLIASLSSLIGTQQAFMCGISNWTNQQGQPVRSLWINGVGPQTAQAGGGQFTPQQAITQQFGPAQPQPQQQWSTQQAPQQPVAAPLNEPWQQKNQRIHRQTATKVAAMLLGFLDPSERTIDGLLRLSERLVAYYDHGLPQANPDHDGDPGPYAPPPEYQ